MLNFLGASRSEKIGQFTAHLLIFVISSVVLFLHCTSYDFYYALIEINIALLIIDIIGVITGLGGMLILIRGYLNPKHHF